MIPELGTSELFVLVFWGKGPAALFLRGTYPMANVPPVGRGRAQCKWLRFPLCGAVLLPEGFQLRWER